MVRDLERRQRTPSFLACAGALLAGAAVGLGAYASHGIVDPGAQGRLATAALFAFGHGLALAALARSTANRLGRLGLWLLLLGTLVFSGSLAMAVLAGSGTRLAPVGGLALMAGWLAWAVDAVRR